MEVKVETQNGNMPQKCAGCGKIITDRYMLKALDMLWHEDCLKCGCCDCRLGEVGSTLYTKANLLLCRRDYLRLFGNTGYCAACSKVIPAFEMVMRARHNVYHLECFACQQCSHRFCVGDRFYLCENKILCEYDYEERMVFANMAYNTSSINQLKRQASGLPVNNNNNNSTANNNMMQQAPQSTVQQSQQQQPQQQQQSQQQQQHQQQQQQQQQQQPPSSTQQGQTTIQCNVTVNEESVVGVQSPGPGLQVQVSTGYHHAGLLEPVGAGAGAGPGGRAK